MMRSTGWVRRTSAWFAAAACCGAAVAQAPRSGSELSADEALWSRIESLASSGEAATGTAGFEAELSSRRALLAAVQNYLQQFPGGARRDEAVRREMLALYEIGMLSGGEFATLRERAEHYSAHPPSEVARAEAAYWLMLVRRFERNDGDSRPAAENVLRSDGDLAARRRAFVEQFPTSIHSPRMYAALFAEACAAGQRDEMRAMAERAVASFPGSFVAATMAARLRREEAIGSAAWIEGRAGAAAIDTRAWAGAPVVVVFWAEFDSDSLRRVEEVESMRREQPAVRVLGVNLDRSEEVASSAAAEVGVEWPQVCDGRGWTGELARQWGVDRLPLVLVIDGEGCLMGAAEGDEWRAWVERCVR